MKNYTKTYMTYFGYGISDFIPCEICGTKAVDIHHIHPRSTHKHLENDITNLMAVCRECHVEFGDKKEHRGYLIYTHAFKL